MGLGKRGSEYATMICDISIVDDSGWATVVFLVEAIGRTRRSTASMSFSSQNLELTLKIANPLLQNLALAVGVYPDEQSVGRDAFLLDKETGSARRQFSVALCES